MGGYTTAPPSQLADTQTQGSDYEKTVLQSREVSGLWTAGRGIAVAATEDARLLVCGMFAIFVGAAVLTARLRITGSDQREGVWVDTIVIFSGQCSDRIPLRCTNYKALKSQL